MEPIPEQHVPAPGPPIDVDDKVKQALRGTSFEAASLERLSGGSVNWAYRATLSKPLDDGTSSVLVKHGETYMLSKPEFPLTLLRCSIEVDILRALSGSSAFGRDESSSPYAFDVRTPRFLGWDERSTNQILELLPGAIDLKSYMRQVYREPTPETVRPQCRQMGEAIGRWIRGFVEWSAQQADLRQSVGQNTFAQDVKHMINFLWLHDRISDFPEILNDVKDTLAQVEQMARKEREEASGYQVIHGDFWTGNIILPPGPIDAGSDTPLLVIDWECTQLGLPSSDFGQMIAEFYALWLCESVAAGLWAMEGFVDAYGPIDETFAFRTALQAGAHLLSVITSSSGMGTPERISEVARLGRDIIVHAWEKDRAWFEAGDLACLFRSVT